jgi:broad specificity phosphatase PhoE
MASDDPSNRASGRLIFVRHGESEGNRDRRFTHSTEVPLTDVGRAQARAAAVRIRRRFAPARVIASPYARARETGEIIAVILGLPFGIEPEVREQHMGRLMGQPYDAALSDPSFDPTRLWEWRPSGGEALVDVRARVAPALAQLARAHAAREIVVVAHAGVMHAVWAHITDTWHDAPHIGNASILLVEHHAGAYRRPVLIEDE